MWRLSTRLLSSPGPTAGNRRLSLRIPPRAMWRLLWRKTRAVWHHKVPTDEEYQKAMEELKRKEAACCE